MSAINPLILKCRLSLPVIERPHVSSPGSLSNFSSRVCNHPDFCEEFSDRSRIRGSVVIIRSGGCNSSILFIKTNDSGDRNITIECDLGRTVHTTYRLLEAPDPFTWRYRLLSVSANSDLARTCLIL